MTTTGSTAVTLTQDSTSSPLPKFKAPSVETFSFKAPLLPASSVAAAGSSKQRRVSLALPSSPRVVPTSAWTFRDDTGLEEKKGKLRKIVTDGDEESHERKLRKKWSQEETQMLVDGCNRVRGLILLHFQFIDRLFSSTESEIGRLFLVIPP